MNLFLIHGMLNMLKTRNSYNIEKHNFFNKNNVVKYGQNI